MTAQLITYEASLQRVQDGKEKPYDRRLLCMVSMGQWRRNWRAAQALGDYEALARLDREYEFIMAI